MIVYICGKASIPCFICYFKFEGKNTKLKSSFGYTSSLFLISFSFRQIYTTSYALYFSGPQGGEIEFLNIKNDSARVIIVDNVNELFSVMTQICLSHIKLP